MTEAHFITKHEAHWQALATYNDLLHKGGIKRLEPHEVKEFARLFRLAGYHLAYAGTHFPNGQAVIYLNDVVGVAHNHFYVRPRSAWKDVRQYFTRIFPQAVRDTWGYSLTAFLIFTIGVLFAGIYVAVADGYPRLIPMTQAEIYMIAEGLDVPDWDGALMTAFFITNNTTVAFNAFVLGIFGGIGTAYILFYNGIMLGGLVNALSWAEADLWLVYSLILPHGVMELAAIFLCGAAGLLLGRGLLVPGKHTRRHSLVLHAKRAALLVPGIVAMLAIAALIEAFFTPLAGVSPYMKLAFAGLSGVAILGYFFWIPRKHKRRVRTGGKRILRRWLKVDAASDYESGYTI